MKILRCTALALITVITLSLLCGCGASETENLIKRQGVSYEETTDPGWRSRLSGESETALAQSVLSAADAFNRYDANVYMSFVSPESPVFDVTMEDVKWVSGYALETTVEDVTVLYLDGDVALVGVTQLTRQVGEAKYEFTSSRTATIHSMHFENGRWLFYESVVVSDIDVSGRWELMLRLVEEYCSAD